MRKRMPPIAFILLLGIMFPTDRRPWASGAAGASNPSAHTLIFAQTANGGSADSAIRSTILIMNNTGRTASGVLHFFGDSGAPMTLGTSVGTGDSFSLGLAAGHGLRVDTDGSGPLQTGWARVDSDVELSGSGFFAVTDRNGTLLSEVGIADALPTNRQMILAENTRGKATAYAVCNPDPGSAATLTFELRSLDGSLLATKTTSFGPLAHRAEYVAETFPQIAAEDFIGVLDVSSDIPVSLVSLRSSGASYTSLPSVPESAPGTDLIFPRVGDGLVDSSRFQTEFFLLNSSDMEKSASLELFNGDGNPMTVSVGSTASNRFTVTVPARGAAVLVTAGQSSPGVLGWAKITGGGSLGGGAIFSTYNPDGITLASEAGIRGTPPAAGNLLYVREKDGGFTGMALTNASGEELTARLRLYQSLASGSLRSEKFLTLPPFSSTGRLVVEQFPDVPEIASNSFEGRLEIATWLSRFGEDVPASSSVLTLLCRGPKYTSLPSAPFKLDAQLLSAFDSKVNELMSRMTLDEKIGQMTQAERGSLNAGDIENYRLGSVLSGGGSGPNLNTVGAWADMVDGFQTEALKTRLQIPLLYGIDAVHGHNNVRGAVIFPHNIGMGSTGNPDLVRMEEQITASEVRATGMNWTFAPVVAVPRDERWGRTYEGFGEDPGLVRSMGLSAVLGFQRSSLADPSSIVACAKHYLGDGGTAWGTGQPIDQGNTQVDEATLRRIHLPGYLGALQAGVGTIMVSFSSWNGMKMSENRYLLTDVLKGELGFEGFLVSDWAAIDQLPYGSYSDQVKAAINAGIDMGMVPDRHREFFSTLKNLVLSGGVPMTRVDDAVRRILRVKFASGLFDRSPLTDRTYQARFGSKEHREAAREAVRQSLVLLKNEQALLPLSKSLRRVFVAGASADDIGRQCGGWTIAWQGNSGNITPGTTVLQGISRAVSSSTQVSYSRDGAGAAGADVGVVVIGETPYAEGPGDSASLALTAQDIAAVNTVKASRVPLVVVLISGRPLILGTVLDKADAFIAAWLPGTEGGGVADVLFGDFRPSGKLPCTWPRSISQIPINIGDANYDPLFPCGFGLTY